MTPMPEMIRCPVCRTPARWEGNPYRPFCSERCKLQDLGQWASESYRVPGENVAGSDDSADGADGEDE